jgi:hypothetical protein
VEALRNLDETWDVDWSWDNDTTGYATAPRQQPISSIEKADRSTAFINDFMAWDNEQEDTRGGSVDATHQVLINFHESLEVDDDAEDRLTLLSMKYASALRGLSREAEARLKILNYTMDIDNPRYTKRDWETLDEAQELVDKLTHFQES